MSRDRENCTDSAVPAWQDSPPRLRPGDRVRVRGWRWEVREVERWPECACVVLAALDPGARGVERTLLVPFDRPVAIRRDLRLRLASRRRGLNAFRGLLQRLTLWGTLRQAAAARIDLLPFQLEPALAVVRGHAPRVLLADDVGLGKTIQAALILAELRARRQATRALILTPAGLQDQWVAELADRFSIPAVIMDAPALSRAVGALARSTNPWEVPSVAISSIDFVKRPEVLRGLDTLVWDLVIVDEAHLAATAAERQAAVRHLGSRARHLLLLTATPHASGVAGLAALADAGRMPGEAPLLMFRRTRADVGLVSHRHVRLLRVQPTEAEQRMYAALDRYTRLVWLEAREETAASVRLALTVLWKRALSCPASFARTIARRLSFLDGASDNCLVQLPLPIGLAETDTEDLSDDREPIKEVAYAPLADPLSERDLLHALLADVRLADAAHSKTAALCALVRRVSEPLLIFTEYRDTAKTLRLRLPPVPSAVLHGGLSRAARRQIEENFRAGQLRILLATDAAGQGLNLQHCCRLVVNVELPWNPVRLEQRIGRVDRLGQRQRVHVVNLLARGTGEETILGRLVRRLATARSLMGSLDDPLGLTIEDHVARAVIAGDEKGLDRLLAGGALADRDLEAGSVTFATPHPEIASAACEETARAIRVRRLGGSLPGEGRVMLATIRPHRGLPPGLIAIFRARLVDGRGGLVEDTLIAVHAACQIPQSSRQHTNGSPLRALVERHAALLCRAAQQAAEVRLRTVECMHQAAARSIFAREVAIAEHLLRRVSGEAAGATQVGLFDRRLLAAIDDRRARQAHTEDGCRRSLETARCASVVELADDPEPVLVFAVPGVCSSRGDAGICL